jgi:hypothetical protein
MDEMIEEALLIDYLKRETQTYLYIRIDLP